MFTARKDTRFAVECPVAYVLEAKKGHGVVFNLSRGSIRFWLKWPKRWRNDLVAFFVRRSTNRYGVVATSAIVRT